MKKQKILIVIKWFILVFFVFLSFSCGFIPQVAKVKIQNTSGNEVINLKLFYEHVNDGNKTQTISSIANGQSRSLSIEIASSSWNSFVGKADIEYEIGEKTFDSNDGNRDGPFPISLSATFETIITINENGWTVTENR